MNILGILIAKISGSARKQTTDESRLTQNQNKFQKSEKKVTEMKKLNYGQFLIHLLSIIIFRKEQSLTKNRFYSSLIHIGM